MPETTTAIQAKDLRVGNWVYWNPRQLFPAVSNEPKPIKVHEIRGESVLYGDIPSLDDPILVRNTPLAPLAGLSSIPLTTELLENIGLKGEQCFVFSTLKCEEPRKDDEGLLVYIKEYRIQVKYLHQLQNLIFALTGTELEIHL